jgi:hypothetical protein
MDGSCLCYSSYYGDSCEQKFDFIDLPTSYLQLLLIVVFLLGVFLPVMVLQINQNLKASQR